MEKIKTISNQRKFANYYFWRTWQQQEIDFIVEKEGRLEAFEFKWAENKRSFPLLFSELYPHSIEQVVTKKNFQSFILDSL